MTCPGKRDPKSRLSTEGRTLLAVTLIAGNAFFAVKPFIAVHLPEYASGSGPIGVTPRGLRSGQQHGRAAHRSDWR